MTSPPRKVRVTCPGCGHEYEDWWRPSVNLALDDFDDAYLEEASTSTCPECGHVVRFAQLRVTEDWEFGYTARAPGDTDPDDDDIPSSGGDAP